MTEANDKYIDLEKQLISLMEQEDKIRDEMDDPWWEMTEDEHEEASKRIESLHLPYSNIDQAQAKIWRLISEVEKWRSNALSVQAGFERLEKERRDSHICVCNYSLKPIGSPGCICEVVNKNLLKELARKLGWEEKEGGLTALYFIAEYIGNPSMGLK